MKQAQTIQCPKCGTITEIDQLKENLAKRGYYITITSGFRTFKESKRNISLSF